ncbi:armadillo-type protein [Hysterangium stoloniferum]|nr:armadillo-type protein [Hysterangium stoloniferum]
MSKIYIMNGLMEKMTSPDQDFRYMALNDLMSQVKSDPTSLTGDENVERKVLQHVLQLVQDKISEVKNQAVKCLGQLIKIIREAQINFVVDSLIDFSGSQEEELRDIASLALKTVTSEIPQDSALAVTACARLAPKLLAQLRAPSTPPETLLETLSILSILISRFPTHMASMNLQPPPVQVMIPLLEHGRPAVRKKAIVTLAQFLPSSSPEVANHLLRNVIVSSLDAATPAAMQRTTIQLLGAIARFSPQIISSVLGEVVPCILKAASQDDDEQKESSLQALETLVLRCPSEITPFLNQTISIGVTLIKYDPNYAGDDDDEDADMDNGDDEDDAELDDEYSDDEDTSYKIRRSATKLLSSVIGTRPELLIALYKSVSPVLISRFNDREESVKLEIWGTYSVLVTQTGVYGGQLKDLDASSPTVGKRKREEEGEMDIEESPYTLLRAQVPSLSKRLLKQLQAPKTSPATLQAGFGLLLTLLTVLPGCLSSQVVSLVTTTKTVLSQPPTTGTSALHVTAISFIALFFATHPSSTFTASLPLIIPSIIASMRERHPRVAAEAFRAFSALLTSLKPVKPVDWTDSIYAEAVHRLKTNDTDSEVRECASELIADLWVSAPEAVRHKGGQEWQALLKSGGRTEGPVKVIQRVSLEADVDDLWVNGCIEWVSNVLKKRGRAGKLDAFVTLNSLIGKYKSGIPTDLAPHLIPQLGLYLTTTDIALLSQSLITLTILLQCSPASSFPEIERSVLKDIYPLAHSPLVSGASLDALLGFFGALVEADVQIASHVVPGLVTSLKKANAGEAVPANVAKVVSRVVRSQMSVAAGMIAEFSKSLKAGSKAQEAQILLSLLVLGELGRFIDMTLQHDVFNISISMLASDSENVRTAAAFAVGNMTIGNIHHFLPPVINLVQTNNEKQLLALHALKEVVSNCSVAQLENVADALWVPLFKNSENSDEATRNVAAACLGKLTTTNPSKYLPQLQARLRDPSPSVRATVVSAIRYTFADTARSYDELLAPLITEFLSLILDEDLNVRRLSLSALNAAARNKPHLIREHLGAILPHLYEQTVVNTALIRMVQMGPWQHKVDDGLEVRKTAYETMYTLLDTCLNKLDLHAFFARVSAGLADESDEIKVLCHMMLFRLSQVAPTTLAQRLDEITPELEKTMQGAAVTKDTVKQDLERTAELQRSALRAIAALSKINNPGFAPKFEACVENIRKSPWATEFGELAIKA